MHNIYQAQEHKHAAITTFECRFLISKYHENCNALSSFIVIRHAPLSNGTLLLLYQ